MTGFNTQPPEGCWLTTLTTDQLESRFNTHPPEGGCQRIRARGGQRDVSTHSRPKAAAKCFPYEADYARVSTHSRPKAAASRLSGV